MYKMEGVGDRVEDHPGAAEDTGPLAHRARKTRLAAGNGPVVLICPLLINLFFSALKYLNHVVSYVYTSAEESEGWKLGRSILRYDLVSFRTS